MRIVDKAVNFFGLEAVDLHAYCNFIAIMRDEVVKKHASVDVLSKDLVNREAQILLAQKIVNLLTKMVDNNVMFLLIFDLVILASFLLSFGIHVFSDYSFIN